MLHALGLGVIRRAIETGRRFGFHCFEYENERQEVIKVTKSRRVLLIWGIYSSWLAFYLMYTFYSLFDSVWVKDLPMAECTIQVVMGNGVYWYTSTNFCTVRKAKELAEFLTNFLKFEKQITPSKEQEPTCEFFGRKLQLMYLMCLGTGIFHAPMFLALPDNSNYIYSTFAQYVPASMENGAKLSWSMMELWTGFGAWSAGGAIYALTFCIVPYSFFLWSDVMKYGVERRPLPMKRTKYYRILQLLNIQFNDTFAKDGFFFTTLGAWVGVLFCTYGALRFYNSIPLMAYLLLPNTANFITMYIFIVFPNAGRARESHMEMVREWRYIIAHQIRDERKENKKDQVVNTKPKISRWENVRDGDDNGSRDGKLEIFEVDDDDDIMKVVSKSRGSGDTSVKMEVVEAGDIWEGGIYNSYSKRKYNVRFFRSCRPIGINVGSYFTVQIGTTFTFWSMVTDQLVTLLIFSP